MKLLKCIQRNTRPSDAYNDGSVEIATGPERSGSAYNAVRSSDTHANASAIRPKESERSLSIVNAVVERCDSRIDAAHGRMRIENVALIPENLPTAATVSLLRARARTLRAKYERMRRCHENYAVHNFNFLSPEGGGSDADCIIALRQTNLAHERWLDSTMALMERDPAALQRWNKANERAGKKNTMWEARDDAIWQELERRRDEVHEHISILAPTIATRAESFSAVSSAQGNTARAVYSAKF